MVKIRVQKTNSKYVEVDTRHYIHNMGDWKRIEHQLKHCRKIVISIIDTSDPKNHILTDKVYYNKQSTTPLYEWYLYIEDFFEHCEGVISSLLK